MYFGCNLYGYQSHLDVASMKVNARLINFPLSIKIWFIHFHMLISARRERSQQIRINLPVFQITRLDRANVN
jgi:hypothetical protein